PRASAERSGEANPGRRAGRLDAHLAGALRGLEEVLELREAEVALVERAERGRQAGLHAGRAGGLLARREPAPNRLDERLLAALSPARCAHSSSARRTSPLSSTRWTRRTRCLIPFPMSTSCGSRSTRSEPSSTSRSTSARAVSSGGAPGARAETSAPRLLRT